MALASDLMGFGMPAQLAGRIATGGTGPLTLVAIGSSYATATKILTEQGLVSITASGATTTGVSLPPVGSDAGALLADDYVINNAGTSAITIYASTGVLLSMNGSNNSTQPILSQTTVVMYPVSTTQWIGLRGN